MILMPTLSRIKKNEHGVSLIEYAIILSLIFVVAVMAVPGLGHWTAKTLCEIPVLSSAEREYSNGQCCQAGDTDCLGSPSGGCSGMFCG